jgi:sulfite exporter TauE/SafE
VQGAMFMLLFGLSTVPALAIVALGGSWISTHLKAYIPRSVSFLAVLSGIIILLRGLLMTFPDFYQMVRVNAAGLITVCGV